MLASKGPMTIRGSGYSYAPASLGNGTLHVDMRGWRGVSAFDRLKGVLEVEAGVTLGDVHRLSTPAGWHLPSQPGYPEITIGGCIAGDVHGKNQHLAGNFRHSVLRFRLWHPDHGIQDLVPGEPLFDLTVGGLGMTGVILSAVLQLERLVSPVVIVTTRPITDAASTAQVLASDPTSLFSYTWQNFTSSTRVGRGFAYSARYDESVVHSVDESDRYTALDPQHRGWPIRVMYRPAIVALNAALELSLRVGSSSRPVQLMDFLFPAARRATYFKMFGKAGFHEAQVLVPHHRASDYLGALAELARSRRAPVALASCKLFSGESEFIRFDGQGIVVAVDAPRDARGTEFIHNVHRLMLEHEGRPNLLKDSLLSLDIIEATMLGLDDFRNALRAFDPNRRFRSILSERIGL